MLSQDVHRARTAGYIATGSIDVIHDLTSLETACYAVTNYILILAQTSPEDQETVQKVYGDSPTLSEVLTRLHTAAVQLYPDRFAGALAHGA